MSKVQRFKNILFAFLVIASLVTIAYFSFSKFFSANESPYGSGTSASPYLITAVGDKTNPEEGTFYYYVKNGQFASTSNYYFKQTADLELAVYNVSDLCNFTGTYDGNNKKIQLNAGVLFNTVSGTISNLNFENPINKQDLKEDSVRAAYVSASLAVTLNGATISNIKIIDYSSKITADLDIPADYETLSSSYTKIDRGGIAVYSNTSSDISNCSYSIGVSVGNNHSNKNLELNYFGGMVAYSQHTTYRNCIVYSNEYSRWEYAGGMVGCSYHDKFNFCYTAEDSTIQGGYAGGIAGFADDVKIASSANNSFISGKIAGGLVGFINGGSIALSYNWGEIETIDGTETEMETTSVAGGLIGTVGNGNYETTINSCYNSGIVRSNLKGNGKAVIGGLVGDKSSDNASIKECYNIGTCTKPSNANVMVGSLFGFSTKTEESQIRNTFNIVTKFTSDVVLPLFGGYTASAAPKPLQSAPVSDKPIVTVIQAGGDETIIYDYNGFGSNISLEDMQDNANYTGWLFGAGMWRWLASPSYIKIDGLAYSLKLPRLSTENIEFVTPHQITFHSGIGGVGTMKGQMVFEEKDTKLRPNEFTREDYKFDGWALTQDGEVVYKDGANIRSDKDLDLYAVWTLIDTYILKLDAGDGTFEGGVKTYDYVVYTSYPIGEEMPSPKPISGYRFTGYKMNDEYINMYTIYSLKSNSVAYANYVPIHYHITYDANGGSGTITEELNTYYTDYINGISNQVSDKIRYNYDEVYTLREKEYFNGITKEGYILVGLSLTKDGDIVDFGAEFSNLTVNNHENITFYLIWKDSSYMLTLDSDGGTFDSTLASTKTIKIKYGEKFGELETPTKLGYKFKHFVNKETGEEITSETVLNVLENLTAIAEYTPISYTIQYYMDLNSTSYSYQQKCNYGTVYKYPGLMSFNPKEGYTLIGFSTDGGDEVHCKLDGNFQNITTVDGMVLKRYCVWEKNYYNIVFHRNYDKDDTIKKDYPTKVSYGDVITVNVSDIFTRDHYDLESLNNMQDGSGSLIYKVDSNENGVLCVVIECPTGGSAELSLDLYCIWTASSRSIILNANGGTFETLQTNTVTVSATYNEPMPTVGVVPTRVGYTLDGFYYKTTKYYNADMTSARSFDIDAVNIELLASWIPNEYNVNLDYDDGSGTIDKTTVQYMSMLASVGVLPRLNYTFGGYYTGKNGTGDQFIDKSGKGCKEWNIASDGTLYAYWVGMEKTITFHKNDGSGEQIQKIIRYGETIYCEFTTFTRDKYTLLGWSTSSSATTPEYSTDARITLIDGLFNLYAVWKLDQIAITYYKNGGEFDTTSIVDYQEPYNVTLIELPSDWAREEYDFLGWGLTDNATTQLQPNSAQNYSEPTSLYAIWKLINYTVKAEKYSLSPDAGCVYSVSQDYCNITGTKITFNAVLEQAYEFVGWYDSVSNGNLISNKSSYIVTLNSKTTYYAYWKAREVATITYSSGTSGLADQTFDYYVATIQYAKDNMFSRTGYRFLYWLDKNSNVINPGDPIGIESGGNTLTAQWVETVTISFNLAGGTGSVPSCFVDKGSGYPSTVSVAVTKTHYTFAGWYTSSKLQIYSSTGTLLQTSATLNSSITLTAHWTAVEYTITLNADGGSCSYATVRGYYGSTISLPTATKSGYTFNGWNKTKGSTTGVTSITVTGNATYYAAWQQIVYYSCACNNCSNQITSGSYCSTCSGYTICSTCSSCAFHCSGHYTCKCGSCDNSVSSSGSYCSTCYGSNCSTCGKCTYHCGGHTYSCSHSNCNNTVTTSGSCCSSCSGKTICSVCSSYGKTNCSYCCSGHTTYPCACASCSNTGGYSSGLYCSACSKNGYSHSICPTCNSCAGHCVTKNHCKCNGCKTRLYNTTDSYCSTCSANVGVSWCSKCGSCLSHCICASKSSLLTQVDNIYNEHLANSKNTLCECNNINCSCGNACKCDNENNCGCENSCECDNTNNCSCGNSNAGCGCGSCNCAKDYINQASLISECLECDIIPYKEEDEI